MTVRDFVGRAALQEHPLRVLDEFLKEEERNRQAQRYQDLRFVGYVLEIGYDTAKIITSDPFKTAVGGIPRNSHLIMVPAKREGLPAHFTLLRVLQSAPTPLGQEIQQTYFELQKKSMPELDVFTQAELQWGALECDLLGMFYPHPTEPDRIEFAGDLNNFVSAHKYMVYAPNDALLDLIVNGNLPTVHRFSIGKLRPTESRLPLPGKSLPDVEVQVSADDFKGARNAFFGKTRLGKSNVVKLVAESLIRSADANSRIGQLIFDSDGEYANDNPQDGNTSLASAYPNHCTVYAITPKAQTPSRPLRVDFYGQPQEGIRVLGSLLREQGRKPSIYVDNFLSVDLPTVQEVRDMPLAEQRRPLRKILMYWAVLWRAGFQPPRPMPLPLDPQINQPARALIYAGRQTPPPPGNLDQLAAEMDAAVVANRRQALPSSTAGKDLFDPDDLSLLNMLVPTSTSSAGPKILGPLRKYHDPNAGNFVKEILDLMDAGKTVILDLGNAAPELMNYFSALLSDAIFYAQVDKFSNNKLGGNYVQLVFEEAHNLFGAGDTEKAREIYRRLAKEGAKFHIGICYSTQSVTSVDDALLEQTENWFIFHMSSRDQVKALGRVQTAYEGIADDILNTQSKGHVRMLTRSHRFVIPVQVRLFAPPKATGGQPPAPTNGTVQATRSDEPRTDRVAGDELPF